MYNKVECICLTCDNCGETFMDDHSGFSIYPDENGAHEAADNDGWYLDKKHYCTQCHTISDKDELVVDMTRTKPLDWEKQKSIDVGDVEYILCAAIWYRDFPLALFQPSNIETGLVLCGKNHAAIIQQHVILAEKKQSEMGYYIQGFITSKNRFLDRKEAMVIAISANQVNVDKHGNDLFSEDLGKPSTDVGEQEDAYVIQLEDALVGLVGWFDKYKEMLDKVFKLSDDDTKMQVPKAVTEAKRVLDLKR